MRAHFVTLLSRIPPACALPSNYEYPKVIHSPLLYIDLSLTSAICSASTSQKFEMYTEFQLSFSFTLWVIVGETAGSMAMFEGAH